MTTKSVKTSNSQVHATWIDLRKDLNHIIKAKGGNLKTCGVKYWDEPINIDLDSGDWAARATRSKPNRWLFTYCKETNRLDMAQKIGYFSLRNEAMAFAARIFIVTQEDDGTPYKLARETEWMVVFVTKTLTPRGSSGAVAYADDLQNGVLSIHSDDRNYGVELSCCALMAPTDMLQQPENADMHERLVSWFRQTGVFFDLSLDAEKAAFLSHVDSISLLPQASIVQDVEQSWLSESDKEHCLSLFNNGQTNLILWGNDRSSLNSLASHLCQEVRDPVLRLEALPTWDHTTLIKIDQQINLTNKIVFVFGVERLDPERVLPPILSDKNETSLCCGDGLLVERIKQKPKSWIFVLCDPIAEQVRRLHRVSGEVFCWFRLDSSPIAVEAVQKIYQDEKIAAHNKQWSENLFVLMWNELQSHLSIAPEAIAQVVRSCLRQDPAAAWDLYSSSTTKQILVRAIEAHLSPQIASLPRETRKVCINSIVNTLEIPLTCGKKLLTLISVG